MRVAWTRLETLKVMKLHILKLEPVGSAIRLEEKSRMTPSVWPKKLEGKKMRMTIESAGFWHLFISSLSLSLTQTHFFSGISPQNSELKILFPLRIHLS